MDKSGAIQWKGGIPACTHRDGGDSAIGICKNPTRAFLLSARIEMCKDALCNQWTRPESDTLHQRLKIVLSSNFHQLVLCNVLELVNEGFTATGLPGLPPSCHLMGSRLPKPHLANNSASVFLDFNFPNVLRLPSRDYLNKSMTRPEPLTELQQTWWYEMCMGGYERKCCQTGGAGNYYWAVACRTKSCWQARPSGMFRQKTQEMPVGHPPFPHQTDASTNTNTKI